MFRYYFQLGIRSLRRNPMLTALMVVTLAVGVAASMATFTVLYTMSGDPIPAKSDRLFVVQVDNNPADTSAGDPPPQLKLTVWSTRVSSGVPASAVPWKYVPFSPSPLPGGDIGGGGGGGGGVPGWPPFAK